MMTLTVEKETLNYYVQNSQVSQSYLESKMSFDVHKVLSGEKQPTFNQLSEIAKKINVPTGLLLLHKKIDTDNKRLEFRTINSEGVEKMTPELRDTISEMQMKQDFLHTEVENEVTFVGKYSVQDSADAVVESMRQDLGVELFWQKAAGSNPLDFFRKKINHLGAFVFFNGKVKDNTHRPLSVEEFRGFVLADSKAPLIFINQKDSKNGQIFTLIHELVHLYVGQEDIFSNAEPYNRTEAFVNKVTAELLVPENEFLKQDLSDIEALARYFKVSKDVIVRRLFDLKKISKAKFDELNAQLREEFSKIKKNKSDGGNYNNNLKFRIDSNFVNYVQNAVSQNRISTTEAINLVGVKFKGYKTLTGGKA